MNTKSQRKLISLFKKTKRQSEFKPMPVQLARCLLLTAMLATTISCSGLEYGSTPMTQLFTKPVSMVTNLLPTVRSYKISFSPKFLSEPVTATSSLQETIDPAYLSPGPGQYPEIPSSFYSCMPVWC
jgi:hypothetical protein